MSISLTWKVMKAISVAWGSWTFTPFMYLVQFWSNFKVAYLIGSRENSEYEGKQWYLSCKSVSFWFIKRWLDWISSKAFYFSSLLQICLPTTKTVLNSDAMMVSCFYTVPIYVQYMPSATRVTEINQLVKGNP